MKKIVCFLLVFVLIPVLSFAVPPIGDSPYYGRWAGVEHPAMSKYSSIVHFVQITEFTTSNYYVFYTINGGPITSGSTEVSQYSDHWQALDDGSLRVPTSPVTYVDLHFDEDGNLVSDNPSVVYVRLP